MKPELDLSVVILNYNGGPQLKEVVAAAAASRGVALGIVLVDNASTDGSLDALRLESVAFDQNGAAVPILILRTGRNLGYAGGNNIGLCGFPSRYVALLNNDAVLDPDTLASLVRVLDTMPQVGACAPRLDWPDGRAQAYSYGGDPSPAYLLRRALARRRGRDLHPWAGGEMGPVDWVAGTCMVLRMQALAEVGLLDEGTFMYFEDNDLCLRLRQRGWSVYFVPYARVQHFNRPSYADRTRQAAYYRGLARFYRRHYGLSAGVVAGVLGWARLLAKR